MSGMGQRENDAAVKDAQNRSKREECALGMGQRSRSSKYAAEKDAQIKLKTKECARGMGQLSRSNFAAVKDVQIQLRWEERA